MQELRSVKGHQPILTVKIRNVVIKSDIGQDWSIEVTPIGFSNNASKIRRGKQNTFLLQTAWDINSPSDVYIQIKFTERDIISDIFGPEKVNLEVDKTLPIEMGYRKGQKNLSVVVEGRGGDGGRIATIEILFEWFLSSNMDTLVSYIHNEMVVNQETEEFIALKTKLIANTLESPTNYLLAATFALAGFYLDYSKLQIYSDFQKLVGSGGPWDHKPAIIKACGEWSLDSKRGILYRFDIFSNIHYGYIARAAGFNKDELLDGAGLAQALSENRI